MRDDLSPELAPTLAVELGLKLDEYDKIVAILERTPTITELYMYSLMWSEHCSYKHSRKALRMFPTTGPFVLQGPGENAGVISVGDGWAVAFKMESHNHPSAIEPYQGAATGVGGIIRDIFTMGARPIASLDSLRFGTLDKARQRYLFEGSVAGIGGYGNCLGVPTVGGEVYFDEAYEGNCLINAMSIGLMREENLTSATASGPGNLVAAHRLHDRSRRHRRRLDAREPGVRREGRGQAAERPGRRPVRGEAAHRGVPRAARGGPARGPRRSRRGGPHEFARPRWRRAAGSVSTSTSRRSPRARRP